jgi:hypothetical protein
VVAAVKPGRFVDRPGQARATNIRPTQGARVCSARRPMTRGRLVSRHHLPQATPPVGDDASASLCAGPQRERELGLNMGVRQRGRPANRQPHRWL